MDKLCKRVTHKGEPCKNKAMSSSDFCLVHSAIQKRGIGFYLGAIGSVASIIGLLIYFMYPVKTESIQPNISNTVIEHHAEKFQTIINNRTVTQKNILNGSNENVGPKPSPSGATCQAWTVPTFNPYPVTYDDVNTPFCHDFPTIDVTKDISNPRWATSEEEYNSIRKFKESDVIVVGLYMDNGGVDSIEYRARNVQISTLLTKLEGVYEISALFTGDNVASKSGKVLVEIPNGARLEVIPKTGYIFDYQGRLILDHQRIELGNTTYALGNLDAGFDYSLFFTFKVRVVS